MPVGTQASARDRIVDAAYELFSRDGVRAVGVDAIIARSGVAKATFYRQFPSKDDLVIEFLRQRDERWTHQWLLTEVSARAETAEERLLAIFDVLDEWFRLERYEGCSFVRTRLEVTDAESPIRAEATKHVITIRDTVAALAEAAGVPDPQALARQWLTLVTGAVVSAEAGDRDAALLARQMAELTLAAELARRVVA